MIKTKNKEIYNLYITKSTIIKNNNKNNDNKMTK